MSRARTWCFTINNPSDNDIPRAWPTVGYCVWQLEEGASKTPHLQGTISFTAPMRMAALKKIDPNAHWEPTRSEGAAVNYCQKEEGRLHGPWTIGRVPRPGKSRPYEKLCEDIIEGKTLAEVALSDPACASKHHKSLEWLAAKTRPKRTWPTQVICYYGDTGTGKTKRCYDEAPDLYKKPTGPWWDGYDGQQDVLLDDYYGDLTHHELLNVLDRYPHQVPFKGGFTQLLAKRIFITSNKAPWEWYNSDKHPFSGGPLERRMTTNGSTMTHIGPYTGFAI